MSTGLPSESELPESHVTRFSEGRRAPERGLPEAEVDWRTYANSVGRHKRLIGIIVVVGLLAAAGGAQLLNPTYSARANLWAEVAKDGGGNPGPTWSSQLLGSAGWIDLLRSDMIVVDAVRAQRLYLKPRSAEDASVMSSFGLKEEFRPGVYRLEVDQSGKKHTLSSDDGSVSVDGVVGDSVGGSVGFAWLPPAAALEPRRTFEFEVLSINEATAKLLENLIVRPGRERSFIHIELHGSDPVRVTATANSMASKLVAVATDLKRQKLTELTAILGEQLSHADSAVTLAEAELKSFRSRTATLGPERDPLASAFVATRIEQEQVRSDREGIARVLAGRDGQSLHALEMIGAVQRQPDLLGSLQELTSKEAELRALRRRYTNVYPAIQQLAADVENLENGTIRALALTLTTELAARDRRLAERVQSASRGLREISPLPVEEGRLSRNVRVAEELFIDLRRRHEESRLAEISVTPDVRLLDAATIPEKPLYNRAPLAIALGLVISLIVGVATAVLVDLFDPKVRYPAQISRQLGLQVLGVVPHVPRRSGKGQDDVAPIIEALRGVRLNVLHAYGSAGPLMLTVTSPGMGDGKSFITSNLALSFADAGYRTLLIDGDIRRGALHRVLNASRKPGLTDFLDGEVPAEAITQVTSYPGLSFIGSGARRRAGPELLSSATMARFVTGLRSSYDVVLIDSSPLAAGIDPYALSTLTGHMLLVLRAGVTDRQLAETKLNVLDRLPVRILGSVVNDVPPGSDYRYHSYYLAGYELEEEVVGTGRGRRILPHHASVGAGIGGAFR